MSSPSNNPPGSQRRESVTDTDGVQNLPDEDACLSDVLFPDASQFVNDMDFAATAENYNVHSSMPIVRCVSEEKIMTDVGSPETNSENLSASATATNTLTGADRAAPEVLDDRTTLSSSLEMIRQQQMGQSSSSVTPTSGSTRCQNNFQPQTQVRTLKTEKPQLRRVNSFEWPDDDPDKDEAKFSSSKSSPDMEAPLRTRFEATFEQAERVSQRLLQKFEVTFDAKKTKKTNDKSKRRKQPASRRSTKCAKKTPSVFTESKKETCSETSSLDQSISDDCSLSSTVSQSSQHDDQDDLENDLYDDEPLVKLCESDGSLKTEKPLGKDAQKDADLFQQLLEKLDAIMIPLDGNSQRTNIRDAVGLVGKDFEKTNCEKKASNKTNMSTGFTELPAKEVAAVDEDLQTMVPNTAAAEAAAWAALAAADRRESQLSVSDPFSSHEDKVDPDTIPLHAADQPTGEVNAALTDDSSISDALHQVYSNYLAKDSNDKVKRQIGTHYLRQFYEPEEQFGQQKELELKRRQLYNSRLSNDLVYCTYLIPLAFVVLNLGAMALFSSQILVSESSELNYWLVMYGLTVGTAGLCYCFNIFAPETNSI